MGVQVVDCPKGRQQLKSSLCSTDQATPCYEAVVQRAPSTSLALYPQEGCTLWKAGPSQSSHIFLILTEMPLGPARP